MQWTQQPLPRLASRRPPQPWTPLWQPHDVHFHPRLVAAAASPRHCRCLASPRRCLALPRRCLDLPRRCRAAAPLLLEVLLTLMSVFIEMSE
jgi:hypothetical protein